jgi:hypothetical protein
MKNALSAQVEQHEQAQRNELPGHVQRVKTKIRATLIILVILSVSICLEFKAGWSREEILESALIFGLVLGASIVRSGVRKEQADSLWITALIRLIVDVTTHVCTGGSTPPANEAKQTGLAKLGPEAQTRPDGGKEPRNKEAGGGDDPHGDIGGEGVTPVAPSSTPTGEPDGPTTGAQPPKQLITTVPAFRYRPRPPPSGAQ